MKLSILVFCMASASAFTPLFTGRMDTSLSISSKELNQRKAAIDQQYQRKLQLEADIARKSAAEAKARHQAEENVIKEAHQQKTKALAAEQTAALQKAKALAAEQTAALRDQAAAAKKAAEDEEAKIKTHQIFAEAKHIVDMDHTTLAAKYLQETAKSAPSLKGIAKDFLKRYRSVGYKNMGDLERRAVEAKEMAEHARVVHYATEAAREAAFEAKRQAAKILEEATFEDLEALQGVWRVHKPTEES
jgi:DNA polymerase elongation subunit (family B)